MTKGIGKGNVSMKHKAHSKARYKRAEKETKKRVGLREENECYLISLPPNLEDSALDGITIDEIPKDYLVQHRNKVAIQDKSTQKIVRVISFTKFEDIESSKKYEDFEKLTKSLAKLQKGHLSFIKNNKAQVNGKMFALGWRGGMDRGYTMGHYVMAWYEKFWNLYTRMEKRPSGVVEMDCTIL